MRSLIVAGAALLLVLYQIGSAAPDVAPAESRPAGPAQQAGDWQLDLLAALGNTAPTGDVIAFLDAWQRAEGGSATYNWLNTTQDAPGATCYNADPCVKNYPDYATGIQATITTLLSDHPGYSEIVAGLATNDVARAFDGIAQSPWGTHAGLIAQVYNEQPPQAAPAGSSAASPIGLDGDCGWNVSAALNANGGALQHVTLAPGETFSFNATMGDPEMAGYRSCAGVPGGNWCNLAARYSQVARAIGLDPQFQHHGVDLGAGHENDVLIWNIGGVPGFDGGRQDLLITNTLSRSVVFVAQSDGASVMIEGSISI